MLRTLPLLAVLPLVALAVAGAAPVARTYPDPIGDVHGGAGPDVVGVTVSSTASTLTFRIRFADAPPLRLSPREQWVDMLLVAVDVPPLGPPPATPGGEWRGADFALGTHGPSTTGQLVRLGKRRPAPPIRFTIVTRGRTVAFTVPRRALGDPRWFAFEVAAAREGMTGADGGFDVAPGHGTFRYGPS